MLFTSGSCLASGKLANVYSPSHRYTSHTLPVAGTDKDGNLNRPRKGRTTRATGDGLGAGRCGATVCARITPPAPEALTVTIAVTLLRLGGWHCAPNIRDSKHYPSAIAKRSVVFRCFLPPAAQPPLLPQASYKPKTSRKQKHEHHPKCLLCGAARKCSSGAKGFAVVAVVDDARIYSDNILRTEKKKLGIKTENYIYITHLDIHFSRNCLLLNDSSATRLPINDSTGGRPSAPFLASHASSSRSLICGTTKR